MNKEELIIKILANTLNSLNKLSLQSIEVLYKRLQKWKNTFMDYLMEKNKSTKRV